MSEGAGLVPADRTRDTATGTRARRWTPTRISDIVGPPRGSTRPSGSKVEEVDVDVTLQYFDGCPNWQVADGRLLEALELAGLGATAGPPAGLHPSRKPRRSDSEARRQCDDIDPFADPGAPVGLSCRVYCTSGGLAGSPNVEQLLAVLT